MADAPTEARAREIIREEIGAALAAAMFGDPDMIAVYASGSITPSEVTQRIDLALKRHQAAEQPRDAVVQRQQPGSASEELGADPVDDGLGRLIPARARLWLEENGL